LTIIQDGSIKHPEEFEQFHKILDFFGGDITSIKTVHAIHNPNLSKYFETERKRIDFLHQNTPNRFKKSDWKELEGKEKRELVIQQLYNKISSFKLDGLYDWGQVTFIYFFFSFIFLSFFLSFFLSLVILKIPILRRLFFQLFMEPRTNQLGEFVLVDLVKRVKQIKDSLEKVDFYFYFFFLIFQNFENKIK